jgi:hypothetical protein
MDKKFIIVRPAGKLLLPSGDYFWLTKIPNREYLAGKLTWLVGIPLPEHYSRATIATTDRSVRMFQFSWYSKPRMIVVRGNFTIEYTSSPSPLVVEMPEDDPSYEVATMEQIYQTTIED